MRRAVACALAVLSWRRSPARSAGPGVSRSRSASWAASTPRWAGSTSCSSGSTGTESWPALRNPVKDARQIKEILDRRYYVDQFIELYDGDASKAAVIRLFGSLIETTRPEDSVLVFYSGHGFLDPLSNTGFWIPVDGGVDRYAQENWIPNAQLRGFIGRMKARHVALVADSCFSGDILDPTRGAAPGHRRRLLPQRVQAGLPPGADLRGFGGRARLLALRAPVAARARGKPPALPRSADALRRDPPRRHGDHSALRVAQGGRTPGGRQLPAVSQGRGGARSAPRARAPRPGPTVTVRKAYGSIEVEAQDRRRPLPGRRAAGERPRAGQRAHRQCRGRAPRRRDALRRLAERDAPRVGAEGRHGRRWRSSYVPQVLDMVYVEGGSFLMGDASKDADDDEKPVHQVTRRRLLPLEARGDVRAVRPVLRRDGTRRRRATRAGAGRRGPSSMCRGSTRRSSATGFRRTKGSRRSIRSRAAP